MPQLLTKFFGELDYTEDALYHFTSGLPGFEDQKWFAFLNLPGNEPLLFMQSLATRTLCFVLLPVAAVDPGYRLALTPEDREELALPPDSELRVGEEILCAALVCTAENDDPTVNLMSPVVVNLKKRLGAQIIQSVSGYSYRHPLGQSEPASIC